MERLLNKKRERRHEDRRMSAKKEKKLTMQEKYENLYLDEIKYIIVTALEMYDTLNLKRLAKLIEKPESSTVRYLKQMLVEKLIVIDAEKTASSWGKFYKLSPEIKKYSQETKQKNAESLKEIEQTFGNPSSMNEEALNKVIIQHLLNKENLDNLDLQLKRNIAFIQNIQRLIVGEFSIAYKELMKQVKDEGREFVENNIKLTPSDVSIFTGSVEISNFKQLFKLLEVFFGFTYEIQKLKEQFKQEMDKENVPEERRISQHIQLFTGSLDYGGELIKQNNKQ